MSAKEYEKAFGIVKYRMHQIGINFEKYVDLQKKLNGWSIGLNFIPKTDWKEFAWALRNSGRFCIDTDIAARIQKGALSWREIVSGNGSGMHVLFRKGKPWSGYEKNIIYFEIHIDSISPTEKQERGKCVYPLSEWGNVLNHAAVDLKHLPFIFSDKKGWGQTPLYVGVRF